MIFIMAYGSKDPWFDLTHNHTTDLFSIGIGDTEETLKPIVNMVIPRINQGKIGKQILIFFFF